MSLPNLLEDKALRWLQTLCSVGIGISDVLKVYLDVGAKKNLSDGVMCLAAVVFKPVGYKQFVRPWNRMLKRWRASAFHASDFYPGCGEFHRVSPNKQRLFAEDSKRIPRLVGRCIKRILLVSFRPDEYFATASPGWKKLFGESVHSMGVQVCLLELGWWAEEHCPTESFAYFMESGDKDEGKVVKTVEGMKKDKKTAAVIRVKSFTTVDKGMDRGLEAADLMPWQSNKYYMDKMRVGRGHDPRKDFAALISATHNEVYSIFLTGANLRFFFSRVPKEVLGE